MSNVDLIRGSEQVVAAYGYWPNFHDAEIVWMQLDRKSREEGGYGPTLEVLIHTFETTEEITVDGYYRRRNHMLIHLQFHEIDSLRLSGFNHQNAIMELSLINVRQRQMARLKWEVKFESAFGVDASLECFAVEVVSVTPCMENGDCLQNKD